MENFQDRGVWIRIRFWKNHGSGSGLSWEVGSGSGQYQTDPKLWITMPIHHWESTYTVRAMNVCSLASISSNKEGSCVGGFCIPRSLWKRLQWRTSRTSSPTSAWQSHTLGRPRYRISHISTRSVYKGNTSFSDMVQPVNRVCPKIS